MSLKRYCIWITLIGILLVMTACGTVATPEPTIEPTPVMPTTVAVVVIDAFEALTPPSEKPPVPPPTENCITDPDGQANSLVSGAANSLISGAANSLISGAANSLVSGASGLVVMEPHGRLVYHELEALLTHRGGHLTSLTLGAQEFGLDWVRDIGRWSLKDGDVLLVAVNTDGYTTSSLETNIPEIVTQLQNLGIDKIVLNMSFAIVPCGNISPVDYQTILDTDYPGLEAIFDDLVAQGVDPVAALEQVINSKPDFAGFPASIRQAEAQAFENTFLPCYGAGTNNRGQQSTGTQGQVAPVAFQVQAQLDACDQVIETADPFAIALDTLLTQVNSAGGSIISIASSGNRGDKFSFAPGYWKNVVSVSAEYSGTDICPALQGELQSNDGEVQMHGVYDCIPGTSFAAPRLSAEAAIYLLRGGVVQCTDAGGTVRTLPPLSYYDEDGNGTPEFENLPRKDASDKYCPDFNVKVVP